MKKKNPRLREILEFGASVFLIGFFFFLFGKFAYFQASVMDPMTGSGDSMEIENEITEPEESQVLFSGSGITSSGESIDMESGSGSSESGSGTFLEMGSGYSGTGTGAEMKITTIDEVEVETFSGSGSSGSGSAIEADESSSSGFGVSLEIEENTDESFFKLASGSGNFFEGFVQSKYFEPLMERFYFSNGYNIATHWVLSILDTIDMNSAPKTEISIYPTTSVPVGRTFIFSAGKPESLKNVPLIYNWAILDYVGNLYSFPNQSSMISFTPRFVGSYTLSVHISDGENTEVLTSSFKVTPRAPFKK